MPVVEAGGPRIQREIRIALVLYGGVSLAIYENGVTRAIYDLVRRRNGLGLLLHLLGADMGGTADAPGARAVVDVIAGTSAGGINGVLLAAALESGYDFSKSAELWRKQGDLEKLLRPPDAEAPESLLRGESFYQEELLKLCHQIVIGVRDDEGNPPGSPCPEMDVFVTGTDFHGRILEITDSTGRAIKDRTHRIVMHLKHRARRGECLGHLLPLKEDRPDRRTLLRRQALLLSCICRLTSSFPIAFPPFQGRQLYELVGKELLGPKDVIEKADVDRVLLGIEELARAGVQPAAALVNPQEEEESPLQAGQRRAYLDGGVLDNKPFGPALRSIFTRLPEGPVDRRLFYVEPHPEDERMFPAPEEPPLAHNVGLGALMRIPRHEEYVSELGTLRVHNERVRTLLELRGDLQTSEPRAGDGDPEQRRLYAGARRRSLARVLAGGAIGSLRPSSKTQDDPRDYETALLRIDDLDAWDVTFHLRRTFDLLYRMYESLMGAGVEGSGWQGVRSLNRLIELLEIVQVACLDARDLAQTASTSVVSNPAAVLDAIQGVLSLAGPFGDAARVLEGHATQGSETLWGLGTAQGPSDPGFLSAQHLSQLRQASRHWAGATRSPGSVLTSIASAVQMLAQEFDRRNQTGGRMKAAFDGFQRHDQLLFLAEYLAGVYELDEIEVMRISPIDAQIGLSAYPGMSKVAGEGIMHFAAFLRRDWRSNDILFGRLDGICRLAEGLLDEGARQRMSWDAWQSVQEFFQAARLESLLPQCPPRLREALATAAGRLLPQAPSGAPLALYPERPTWEALRNALIRALQEVAAAQDLPAVRADNLFQETAWDTLAVDCVPAGAREADIEAAAARVVRQEEESAATAGSAGERFVDLKLGASPQGGGPRVPSHMQVFFLSQAFTLLWRLLERSLGEGLGLQRVPVLSWGPARAILLYPVQIVHWITRRLRADEKLGAMIVFGVLVALLVGSFLAWLFEASWQWRVGLPTAFIAFSLFSVHVISSMHSLRSWRNLLLLGAVGAWAGIAYVGYRLHDDARAFAMAWVGVGLFTIALALFTRARASARRWVVALVLAVLLFALVGAGVLFFRNFRVEIVRN